MASRLMFEVGGWWDGNTLQLNLWRELHQKGAKVLQEAPLDPEGVKQVSKRSLIQLPQCRANTIPHPHTRAASLRPAPAGDKYSRGVFPRCLPEQALLQAVGHPLLRVVLWGVQPSREAKSRTTERLLQEQRKPNTIRGP